jgi:hypothetical protein
LSKRNHGGYTGVSVLPITHTPPAQPAFALQIPFVTKRRLGLYGERSWIVFSESNRFVWPGPVIRTTPGKDVSTAAYGILPPTLFDVLNARNMAAIKAHQSKVVPRAE